MVVSIVFFFVMMPSLAIAEEVNRIDIPFLRQEHRLSCEVATLRMALRASRLTITESELINHLSFDRTRKKYGTWGDPNKGFVGNIDGSMMKSGYGVYAEPIARLGMRWRRTKVIHNITPQELVLNMKQKRPVIVWGFYGSGKPVQWTTQDGKVIKAVNGEHTRLVVGFMGSGDNPSGFEVIDPLTGTAYWSTEALMENLLSFDGTAVAVYPHPRWVIVEGEPTVWELSEDGAVRRGFRTTWEQFIALGGFKEGIVKMDRDTLEAITRGPDITLENP